MGRWAYTPEQNAWLTENYPRLTNRELAEAFVAEFGESVTAGAMCSWGGNHHMRKDPGVKDRAQRKYTDEQLDFLREAIPGRSYRQVSELFEERYGFAISRAALCGIRSRLGVYAGVNAGRFRKGVAPANKGKSWDEQNISDEARARMLSTTFKKGIVPHNTRELLDEKLDPSGKLWLVKVDPRDAPNTVRYWVPRSHLNWERANGRPWPEGHKALHLDGDSHNDDPDNVMPVPDDVWPVLNGAVAGGLAWHDRETAEAAVTYARLTRARARAERRGRIAAGRPRKDDMRMMEGN